MTDAASATPQEAAVGADAAGKFCEGGTQLIATLHTAQHDYCTASTERAKHIYY
jgi:hypothetical protein